LAQQQQSIEAMVTELPPDLQNQVRDFVRHLLKNKRQRKQRYLRQDWAGALGEYRDQYTSLELQKKALEWRGD